MGEIDVIENIYLQEISAILPIIIASFYETSIWVRWKLQMTHNLTQSNTKPCTLQQNNSLKIAYATTPTKTVVIMQRLRLP